jgi:hypothetical protein
MAVFSNKELIRLRELFRKELGLEVSDEEASRHATQLVDLLRVTYRESNDQTDQSPP